MGIFYACLKCGKQTKKVQHVTLRLAKIRGSCQSQHVTHSLTVTVQKKV
jgi:hypothetical protein